MPPHETHTEQNFKKFDSTSAPCRPDRHLSDHLTGLLARTLKETARLWTQKLAKLANPKAIVTSIAMRRLERRLGRPGQSPAWRPMATV